jgi:ribulose bisphosphate carboxylase small subunit
VSDGLSCCVADWSRSYERMGGIEFERTCRMVSLVVWRIGAGRTNGLEELNSNERVGLEQVVRTDRRN